MCFRVAPCGLLVIEIVPLLDGLRCIIGEHVLLGGNRRGCPDVRFEEASLGCVFGIPHTADEDEVQDDSARLPVAVLSF
jgi:hypothetical protein